jgi:hypothetical protein
MKQRTLAMMMGFERYTKTTRRAALLEEMEQVVPWRRLWALVNLFMVRRKLLRLGMSGSASYCGRFLRRSSSA